MEAGKYDIDYRATFPTSNLSDENHSKYSLPNKESNVEHLKKEPVVVLLGWAGCKDRHLAKYIAIYEKRFITISYTAPTYDIISQSSNLRCAAEKLLKVIVDLGLEAHPIFVHCFSNGGCLVYRWISETINSKAEWKRIQLAGAIFDSCPGKRRMFQSLKALTLATNYSIFIKFFLGLVLILSIFLEAMKLEVVRLVRILHPTTGHSDFWHALENDAATCPQLFLFSKADDIISYRHVEEMTAVRRQRGVDVQSFCWEDSVHVGHLLTHRESYIKACLDFIDYCVERHG